MAHVGRKACDFAGSSVQAATIHVSEVCDAEPVVGDTQRIGSSGQYVANNHPNQTGYYMGPYLGPGTDNLASHDIGHVDSNY